MLTRLPDALLCLVFTFSTVHDLLQRATTCRAWNRCMKKPEALPHHVDDVDVSVLKNRRMLEWLGQCGVRWDTLYREPDLLDFGPFRAECIRELGVSWKDLATLSHSIITRLRPKKLMLVAFHPNEDLHDAWPALEHVETLNLSFLGEAASVTATRQLFDACPRLRCLRLQSPESAMPTLFEALSRSSSQSFRIDLHLGLDNVARVLSLLQPWVPLRTRLARVRLGISTSHRAGSDEEIEARRSMTQDIAALPLPVKHIWLDDEVMSLPVELFPQLTVLDWGPYTFRTRSDIEQLAALMQRNLRSNHKRKRDDEDD